MFLSIIWTTVSQVIATANLFKSPIRLKIHCKDYFSSKSGEFLSMVIYAYLLYSLITSAAFTKETPNIMQKDVEANRAFWYNFTESNFFFAAAIFNPEVNTVPLDSSIATLNVTYDTYARGVNESSVFVNSALVYCKDTYVAKANPDLIYAYPYVFCLPNPRFQIGGYFTEQITKSIDVHLVMCQNSTENNHSCQPQANIDAFFLNTRLGYLISDNRFSTDDYNDPIKPRMITEYYFLDTKIRKFASLFIQKVTISDDDALIFTNKNVKDSWKQGTISKDLDFNSNVSLVGISIYSSNIETVIERKYMKIQDALSSLGGIVNVLISVGLLLLRLSPFGGINLFLSNQLFSFRNISKKNADPPNQQFFEDSQKICLQNPFDSPFIEKESEKEQAIGGINYFKNQQFFENPMNKSLQNPADFHLNKMESVIDQSNIQMIPIKKNDDHKEIHEEITRNEEKTHNLAQIKYDESIEHDRIDIEIKADKIIERNFIKKISEKNVQNDRSRKSKKKGKNKAETNVFAEHFKNYSKIKDTKNAMKFELSDFIKSEGRKNLINKMIALKNSTKKINNDLDIINIMQKFQEIDNLKLLLLNKKQLMLFDLIARPEIFPDKELINEPSTPMIMSMSQKGRNDEVEQKLIESVVYYNKIKKKENIDDLEGRLVKLLDKDMKKYLEV